MFFPAIFFRDWIYFQCCPEVNFTAPFIFVKDTGPYFPTVHKFRKSAKIWQRYREFKGENFWLLLEQKSKDYTTFVSSRSLMNLEWCHVEWWTQVQRKSDDKEFIRWNTESGELCWWCLRTHKGMERAYESFARFFLKGSEKQIFHLNWVNAGLDMEKLIFLGHTLHGDHMGPQTESVGRILRTERPKTKKQRHSLLGMLHTKLCGDNCSNIWFDKALWPNVVEWDEKQERAFNPNQIDLVKGTNP